MDADASARREPDLEGYSLANLIEIWTQCFEAVAPKSVLEVGAEHGRLTEALLEWAVPRGVRVIAVEPDPLPGLLALRARHPELELLEMTSLEALERIQMPDVIALDGDHNHYTLSRELSLIRERCPGASFPLVILHDLGWPLGRRDQYHEPERIPPDHRQPCAAGIRVMPGNSGAARYGLSFGWAASHEGGERNGVRAAVEDFLAQHDGFRFALIPLFFGCGVLWSEDAERSAQLDGILGGWDANPVLERVERSRVSQLAERRAGEQQLAETQLQLAEAQAQLQRLEDELSGLEELLRGVAGSRAFLAAELVSRARRPTNPSLSRQRLRLGLDRGGG